MSSKAHFPFSSINFNLPSLYNIECTFTIKVIQIFWIIETFKNNHFYLIKLL